MCLGPVIQLLGAMTDETSRRRETSSRNNSFSSPHSTLTEQQLQSNYKSAFEITSVSDVPPDGEEEGVAGRDGEDTKPGIPELERIEEDYGRLRSGSSSLPELQAEPTIPSQLSSHSQTEFPELSGGAKPLNASAAVGNGPSQTGQSRFRRVNQYTRGRWTVREENELLREEVSLRRLVSSVMAPNSWITGPRHMLGVVSPSLVI